MDKRFSYRNWDIHYRDEGPPAPTADCPLVLVHGFAEDSSIWQRQIEALKDRVRILAPDLPGSGRSSPLREPASIADLSEMLKALLDKEGLDTCIPIGHSMGGYCTLAFAEKYPDSAKGFGLFHSTAFPDTEEKKAARRKGIEFIRTNGAAPFVRQATLNLFSDQFRKDQPEIVETVVRQYMDADAESLIHYYEAMMERPDSSSVLRQSNVPVFFLIGSQDKAVALPDSLRQCHLPTLSHITILQQAAHLGMVEEGRRCNNALESFLNFTFGI